MDKFKDSEAFGHREHEATSNEFFEYVKRLVRRTTSVLEDEVAPNVRRNPLVWALPLQALLLLWNLDLLDPWGDEWFTIAAVAEPVGDVVSEVAANIHPPLYFVLLHYWIQLPGILSPVASMRAMSAVWALVATAIIYMLWLRRERPQFQAKFLALWALSPCILLLARMARSYSMQVALASVAIYSAPRWAEQPRNWKWLLAFVGSSAALLYTHYLSGLAVAGGVWLTFLLQKRFKLVAAYAALLAVLYLPWVPTLISVLHRWTQTDMAYPYGGGSVIFDQIIRLGYLLVSFSFGETFSIVSLVISVALAPVVIYYVWRAVETRPTWIPIVLAATAIAWIGVSRVEQLVFMPNQLLFVLPFFLLLLVQQMNPLVFVAFLVLYAGADYAYFNKSGFLVKPYATPYAEMTQVILGKLREQNAIVAVDPYGAFSEPLLTRLGGGSIPVIILNDEASARKVLEAAQSGRSGASSILLWRRTSDVSPGSFVSKLEQDLSVGREVSHRDFVAYSLPERWALLLLRGPGQPEYYYRLSEFRMANSDMSSSWSPN